MSSGVAAAALARDAIEGAVARRGELSLPSIAGWRAARCGGLAAGTLSKWRDASNDWPTTAPVALKHVPRAMGVRALGHREEGGVGGGREHEVRLVYERQRSQIRVSLVTPLGNAHE